MLEYKKMESTFADLLDSAQSSLSPTEIDEIQEYVMACEFGMSMEPGTLVTRLTQSSGDPP
jgi:hypothetical protein